MKSWKLEETRQLSFRATATSEQLDYRMEVYSTAGDDRTFMIRLFRYEDFRLKPGFQGEMEFADHHFAVQDLLVDGTLLQADSSAHALKLAIDRLDRHLRGANTAGEAPAP